jgi:hypothetical protein
MTGHATDDTIGSFEYDEDNDHFVIGAGIENDFDHYLMELSDEEAFTLNVVAHYGKYGTTSFGIADCPGTWTNTTDHHFQKVIGNTYIFQGQRSLYKVDLAPDFQTGNATLLVADLANLYNGTRLEELFIRVIPDWERIIVFERSGQALLFSYDQTGDITHQQTYNLSANGSSNLVWLGAGGDWRLSGNRTIQFNSSERDANGTMTLSEDLNTILSDVWEVDALYQNQVDTNLAYNLSQVVEFKAEEDQTGVVINGLLYELSPTEEIGKLSGAFIDANGNINMVGINSSLQMISSRGRKPPNGDITGMVIDASDYQAVKYLPINTVLEKGMIEDDLFEALIVKNGELCPIFSGFGKQYEKIVINDRYCILSII